MITKRSKAHVPYLYTHIKYKITTVYIKNNKGAGAYIIVSKGTPLFKYVSKKQSKLRKMKDEIKEKNNLSYITIRKSAFCYFVL